MADDSRKGVAGSAPSVAYLRASSDDRKPPATAAPVTGAAARKITFKSADMKEEMRQEVFECARVAFEKYTVEKDIAEYIKKEFDKNHGPTWHCIVGRNFGKMLGKNLPMQSQRIFLDRQSILLKVVDEGFVHP